MCQPKPSGGSPVLTLLLIVGLVGFVAGKAGAVELSDLPKVKVPKLAQAPPHHTPQQSRPAGRGRAGDVARVSYDVGFRGKGLETAVAVALAESGGRWDARCHNCIRGYREDSRCAFQINVNAHPRYRGSAIYQPRTCARAAYAISGGGRNWRPWSTYKSGSYLRHMGTARAAVRRI